MNHINYRHDLESFRKIYVFQDRKKTRFNVVNYQRHGRGGSPRGEEKNQDMKLPVTTVRNALVFNTSLSAACFFQ